MSKVSHEEVERIAKLANIELSVDEVSKMSLELSNILAFVEQLNEVDTKGVKETSQVTGLVDVFRPDEVRPDNIAQAELLKNAPEQQDGFIKVRRVLE